MIISADSSTEVDLLLLQKTDYRKSVLKICTENTTQTTENL